MSDWSDCELGPLCLCGNATFVSVIEDKPMLLCVFHGREEGVMFPLPKVRPEGWPSLSRAELDECMKRGQAEEPAE